MGEAPAQIPTSFGHELRACLRCRLVKTYDQFRDSGCENCPFFKIEEDHERIVDVTTPNFNGKVCSWLLRSCCLRGTPVASSGDLCKSSISSLNPWRLLMEVV